MSKNLHNIFTVSDCPSEEMLVDYVSGKLETVQKRKVESHLCDCEMCSDFTDGLQLLNKPEQIRQISLNIHAKIDATISGKKKNRYIQFRVIAGIAAILTVLIIVTFILQKQFRQETPPQVAQNQTELKEEAQHFSPVEEPQTTVPKADKTIQLRETYEKGPSVTRYYNEYEHDDDMEISATEDFKNTRVPAVDNTEIIADVVTEEQSVSGLIKTTDEDLEFAKDKNLRGGETKQAETVSLTQTKGTTDRTEAEKTVVTTGSGEKETDLGVTLYKSGDYRGAFSYFEQTLKDNPADQQAQWYFTMTLIKLDRIEEARYMLRAIIDAKGKYRRQAEKELKKLR